MNNPFARDGGRHPGRPPESDAEIAAALRRSLTAHAADAPPGDPLAERIIAGVERTPAPPFRAPRRTHRPARRAAARAPGLPWLVAAAAVVAVLAGIVVAVLVPGSGSARHQAAQSRVVPPPITTAVPPTAAPTTPQTRDTPSPASTQAHAILPSALKHVHVVDATFTGEDSGWALASADCLLSSGRCTALLRTLDGRVWKSHPNTPFNVAGVNGCAAPCVEHIRFATDRIGYAFGPAALYLTTDGAGSWKPLSGGADTLETLDGNVIRVSHAAECPPGCRYTVQTAKIGSTAFSTVTLPGPAGSGDGVALARTGTAAFLQVFGNPAGGGTATSVLWSSADDGAHWTNRGEPCASRGGEADGTALTSAADGSVAVACRVRASGVTFVTVSTDGGASFRAGAASLDPGTVTGFGAASASTLIVAQGHTSRTTDGGDGFVRLGRSGGSTPGNPSYVGFASGTTGHAISADGSAIWTTADAGNSWKAVTFQ